MEDRITGETDRETIFYVAVLISQHHSSWEWQFHQKGACSLCMDMNIDLTDGGHVAYLEIVGTLNGFTNKDIISNIWEKHIPNFLKVQNLEKKDKKF